MDDDAKKAEAQGKIDRYVSLIRRHPGDQKTQLVVLAEAQLVATVDLLDGIRALRETVRVLDNGF